MSITYAYQAGQIVSVSRVTRGPACDCLCVECGEPLTAKQGSRMRWHFAHASGRDEGTCGETAAHRAAKALIEHRGRVRLPDGDWLALDDIEVESPGLGYRADLLARSPRGWVQVEVALSSRADDAKIERLRLAGIPTVEIDITQDVADQGTAALLIQLEQGVGRRWLVHPEDSHPCDAAEQHDRSHLAARYLPRLRRASLDDRRRAEGFAGPNAGQHARRPPDVMPEALAPLAGCDMLVPIFSQLYRRVSGLAGIWIAPGRHVGISDAALVARGLQCTPTPSREVA